MDQKKRVYSGIRATGRLHLGNYFGAVKGMIELQDKFDCVFSVVDLHAITTPYEPEKLQQNIKDVILDYLSAGLDPEKCLIEIQSKVPEHTELAYLLATIYPVSRLEDLPTYKDKKAQYPKYVNMGLLFYPVLMAADIMLYKADLVPTGVDQEPHLEVTREIARRFNSIYGETFPEPQRFLPAGRQASSGSDTIRAGGEYVPSLTGEGKMSKTVEGSSILLTDDLETIQKKIAVVPTDSGELGGEVPNTGGVATLFSLLKLFEKDDLRTKYEQDYREKKIRYSDMKKEVSEVIYEGLKPIQEKRKELEQEFDLDEMIKEHTKICRKVASDTLQETKQKMGLL
jgi:tryptophanyl-tRNA synthetase